MSGESCTPVGGEDEKVGSMRGRLNREDMPALGVLNCCDTCGGVFEGESLRFASVFLFFGTSCSLKGSAAGAGEGEAI